MRETIIYPNLQADYFIEVSGQRALSFLSWYKPQIDNFLEEFFEEKIRQASQVHPEATVLVEQVRRLVKAGGKRVRPAFAYAAYTAAGGRALDPILYASSSLELMHGFALIHDDIIDHSKLRRGEPTAHKVFENYFTNRGFEGSDKDFGLASALLAGDLALSYADEVLNTAPFPAERIRRAKSYYDSMKQQVILGEYLDILAAALKNISEELILKILEYKTAKYTVERPLHIGAALAGADQSLIETFSEYGIALGQAFQIQDDILGTFGNEREIGKPVDSDIKEGKQTTLILRTYQLSSDSEKKLLDETLGNSEAKSDKVKKVRELIKESGALRYSKKLCEKLINRAKGALERGGMTSEGKSYLIQTADYMLSRID